MARAARDPRARGPWRRKLPGPAKDPYVRAARGRRAPGVYFQMSLTHSGWSGKVSVPS